MASGWEMDVDFALLGGSQELDTMLRGYSCTDPTPSIGANSILSCDDCERAFRTIR